MKHTTQHFRNAIVAVLLIPAVAFAAWKFNPHTGKPDYFEVSSGNYTQEEVEDNVAALIQNGTGITWVYNDTAGTLTPTVTSGVGDMLKSVYDVDEDGKVDAIEESILAAYLTAESDPTVDSSAKIQAIIGSGIYATDGHNHSGTYEPVDATIARTGQTNAFGAFNQTFDTSTLVVDAANNRIGIGDTTPDYELDVVGTATANNFRLDNSNYTISSGIGNTNTALLALATTNNVLRGATIASTEYWDGDSWETWSSSGSGGVIDGDFSTSMTVDDTHQTWRFTVGSMAWRRNFAISIFKGYTETYYSTSYNLKFETSTDGITYTERNTWTTGTTGYQHIFLGTSERGDAYWRFTIDYNSAIAVGGTVIFREIQAYSYDPATNPLPIQWSNGDVKMGGDINLNGKWLSGDGDSEGVYVNATGSVGVGDSTPDHKFDVTGNIGVASGGYYNFGDTDGADGYGFRDNSGTVEFKSSGGAWAGIQPANTTLAAIAALEPALGYLHYNGTAFVYDTPSGAAHDAVTLDANAGAILSLNDQEIGLDTQTANYVWAGPVSGDAAVPAFRALVAGDIPDISATYQAANANLTTYAGITPSANAQTLLGQTFAQMQASLSIDDLITLSGVAEGSAHLATFTGSTINDNVTVKAALQALETAVEGKQATVTEGSLADSTIVSADIKDGEITAADTKITAGRSLTWSTDDIAADAELYTRMYNGGIYNVTTGDDAWVQIKPATAITISRISCSCDSGNVTIQFDERAEGTPDSAGTDVMSAALVCDTDTQSTTSFDNAGIAADALINLDIDAVGGTPTKFRFHIDYTVDD